MLSDNNLVGHKEKRQQIASSKTHQASIHLWISRFQHGCNNHAEAEQKEELLRKKGICVLVCLISTRKKKQNQFKHLKQFYQLLLLMLRLWICIPIARHMRSAKVNSMSIWQNHVAIDGSSASPQGIDLQQVLSIVMTFSSPGKTGEAESLTAQRQSTTMPVFTQQDVAENHSGLIRSNFLTWRHCDTRQLMTKDFCLCLLK